MTTCHAIRNPDGQMYLKEENPHYLFENQTEEDEENLHEAVSNLRYNRFDRTHPPVIALFECEEGDSFVEGVDVRLGYAYRDNTKDPEGEYPGFAIDEDDIPSWCPYHKAFQLIEKEGGKEVTKSKIILENGETVEYGTHDNGSEFVTITTFDTKDIWYLSKNDIIEIRDFFNQLSIK